MDDIRTMATEFSEVSEKLAALRERNANDLGGLVQSTDPTLLSKNREQLEELLSSGDGNLRCAALTLLDMRNWTGGLLEKCRSLAISDVDVNVRGIAVLVLARLCSGAADPHTESLLAQIVLNANEQKHVRQAAYRALLDIRRVPRPANEWRRSFQDDFPTKPDLDRLRSLLETTARPNLQPATRVDRITA